MIQKTIHYIWFGKSNIPKDFENTLQSWKNYGSTSNIEFWDEKRVEAEFDNLPRYYFDALKARKWAFASDVARFYILYKYGGIYMDIDQILVKDISHFYKSAGFIGKYHEVDNYFGLGFIGLKEKHPLAKDTIDYYSKHKDNSWVIVNKIISDLISKKDYEINIFDQEYFYPLTRDDFTENTYSYHLSNTSWIPLYKKILWKVPFYDTIKSLAKRFFSQKMLKKLGMNIDY